MKTEQRFNTRVNELGRWGALAAASAALVFLAAGCGRNGDEVASTGSGDPETTIAQQNSQATAAVPAATRSVAGQGVSTALAEGDGAISIDSLPPDVAASVTNTLVQPGEIIEVAAQGSSDVAEINLSDGLGKTQPMTYDTTAGLWRVYYRVPLRTTTDRLGLSVTAKNSLDRWRRVWIFLTVEREGTAADSLSGR
jgi:hypothetical protein